MRYDCDSRGCFNVEMRPKIEIFADCFPGKINFGDCDGIVGIGRRFALLEWKSPGAPIAIAQEILARDFSSLPDCTVFHVEGDPKTMEVVRYRVYWRGKPSAWRDAGLDSLKARIKDWADFAASERRREVSNNVRRFG